MKIEELATPSRRRWQIYEAKKRALKLKNLAPVEYEKELQRICRELKL